MFSTFDLCLLLYVIRLAGCLKHCNLALSLSDRQGTINARSFLFRSLLFSVRNQRAAQRSPLGVL